MRAEKKQKIIETKTIQLPNEIAFKLLADEFGISVNTVKGYLNVSGNRTAEKAINVQVAAINKYRGQLVTKNTYEWTIEVWDDAEQLIYELK